MSKRDVNNLSYTVFCCQGGDCRKQGAREVLKVMRTAVKEQGLRGHVHFIKTECTGQCKNAPVNIVCSGCNLSGQGGICGAVWYRKMTPEAAAAVVEEHLLRGRPLDSKLFAAGDKE